MSFKNVLIAAIIAAILIAIDFALISAGIVAVIGSVISIGVLRVVQQQLHAKWYEMFLGILLGAFLAIVLVISMLH